MRRRVPLTAHALRQGALNTACMARHYQDALQCSIGSVRTSAVIVCTMHGGRGANRAKDLKSQSQDLPWASWQWHATFDAFSQLSPFLRLTHELCHGTCAWLSFVTPRRCCTPQEFNIEKLQLLEAEKGRVRKEYERREGQIDVKKKIEYSKQLNASRIKVLQAREDAVHSILEEVSFII